MADPRPNILFLFSDQHRAEAMSCAGDPNVETCLLYTSPSPRDS